MKKQIKKLNLNKRTISNLNALEMNRHAGGGETHHGCSGNCTNNWCTFTCKNHTCYCPPTANGHTCNNNC